MDTIDRSKQVIYWANFVSRRRRRRKLEVKKVKYAIRNIMSGITTDARGITIFLYECIFLI